MRFWRSKKSILYFFIILIPMIVAIQYFLFKYGLISPLIKGVEFNIAKGNYIQNIDEYIRYFKLRVCHNDTKLSNVLFDKDNKAIALIDIDTIMPGYLIFDYGDGARSCISSLKEDDINYDDLKIDLNKFYMFTKGFLESTISIITNEEIECLVDSIIVITYECALRFLTDFLNNDNYFKTNYCYHNLIRTRNQIKLIEELKNKKNILKNIVNELILEIKK